MLKRLITILVALVLSLPQGVFALNANDPEVSRQWYLNKIGVQSAWDFTQGGDVVVAVLDTGVDIKHPELVNNIWTNSKEIPGNGLDDDGNGYIDDVHGWNFVENNNDPGPQFNSGWTEAGITHGTVIAGVIGAAGNNLAGIAGINWRVKIMSLRILDSQGVGDSSAAAQAIDYAARNGARVLNFSFVTDERNIGLEEAIERAAKAGVLIVAAAGNNSATGGDDLDNTPMYPVCSDGVGTNYVIGVAATDENDKRSKFSNYGTNCVDIAAPGQNIISTQLYNPTLVAFSSYTRSGWSGTSVASPMISGTAALMLAANPGLSRETLVQYLLSTADPIDAINPLERGQLGAGRVNTNSAIKAALGLPVALTSAAPVTPTPTSVTENTTPYIAIGANVGNAPEVRIHSLDGKLISNFLAYHPLFRGGVSVGVGDLDGDGVAEIVTGAGRGGGPHVRVFDLKGNVKAQFFAYDERFRGGVSIAVGDIDGDKIDEIVTGAGRGGGPHVRVFDLKGNVKAQFFAYDSKSRTGINIASGDIDGDGKEEVVVGPASAAGSLPVKYFTLTATATPRSFQFLGQITFLASSATGGVALTVADVGGDAYGDIILGRTVSGSAVTVVFSGVTPNTPFTISGLKGMSLSSLDLGGYGRSVILAAPASVGKIKMFDYAGKAVPGLDMSVPYANGASIVGFSTK